MADKDYKGRNGILGSRLIQDKELTLINEDGETVGTFTAERGSNALHWKDPAADATQLKFSLQDDGILDITDDDLTIDLMSSDPDYDGITPVWIYSDPAIFDEETKAAFLKLPASERPRFTVEALETFYKNNIEYANFSRIKVYKDPLLFLEFFQKIKKGDFKKCGINNNGRYEELQKKLKEAEIAIAKNPIDLEKLITIWPIFRLREQFTESELAALYYLQNPRTENALEEFLEDPTAYYLPFGPYLFLVNDAITHAAVKRNFSFEVTKGGRKKSDRTKSLEVAPVKNGFEITQRKKGQSATVTILNKDLIQSTSAMKLYVFLLSKAAQQHFRPEIYFSLQELVNNGMYSNITNARAGFKNHIAAVQSLQIAGEMKKGKRSIKQSGRVLFTGYDINQNGVKVQVNDDFDLELLASYYATLPAWTFGINNNSFEILLYAFMKARTERSDKINLSLSIIREKLALPTREEYAAKGKKFNAGQFVKKPIMAAIDGIKTAIDINKDKNIKIKEHYIINDKNLDEWLKGYITIELTGDYSANFNQIRERQLKIIEANTERKEAARAMVEAQKEAEKEDTKK